MTRISPRWECAFCCCLLLVIAPGSIEASSKVSVSAGGDHTCAVTSGGGVVCWGDNSAGGLGDGTTTNRPTPVPVAGLATGITAVAAGYNHSCALTSSGGVMCWGPDPTLGDGTATTNPLTPVPVTGLATGVTAIAAAFWRTCAVTSSGGVMCWGIEFDRTIDRTPVSVSGLTSGVTAISTSGSHTCVITSGGGVMCWGSNGFGELGNGTFSSVNSPVPVTGLATGITAIATGDNHTCAVTSGGGVMCWGQNLYGQLGNGTTTGRNTPGPVTGLASGVAAIAAGGNHTCALTNSGGVLCWGDNTYGELGDGTTASRATPLAVTGLTNGVAAMAAGANHTCALSTGGDVMCWGDNLKGELGNGRIFVRMTPVSVSGLPSPIVTVATGNNHACGSINGGGVMCWGNNIRGQLGDGTTASRTTPVAVTGLTSPVTAIAAGGDHTCALKGSVTCWGANNFGELGDGTTTDRDSPTAVNGLASGVTAIAAGEYHNCALTGAGVMCWGYNGFGALGDGTTVDRHTPVAVNGLTAGVTAIAAGGGHTCALTNGGVECWGINVAGQLGDGTTATRVTPVAVSGLASGVVAIATGLYHTCALTSGGGVMCWGHNLYGQLGDGTMVTRTTPVAVSGLASGVTAIAAGFFQTCALTNGGGVMCWGSGELGDGTTATRNTPVAVSGLTSGVTAIAAGGYFGGYTCAVTIGGGVVCWGDNSYGQLGDGSLGYSVGPVNVLEPPISLDPSSLFFTGVNSGSGFSAVTAAQTVRLTQIGTDTVSWTATPTVPWLQVSPTSGSGSSTLSVTVQFVPGLSVTQTGSITINLTGAGNSVGAITVTLNTIAPAAVSAPFGSFDTPTNGATGVAGSVAVTGWSLDAIGVTRVTICRDAAAGETSPVDPNCAGNAQIYIGDAVFIDGARTDVQSANPTLPQNGRGGWGYLMLTNFLPALGNGTFAIRAYAFNGAGLSTALGSKTITCDNAHATKPFGAIDTPTQGGVVSGTIANSGWVLTQSSKDIPADSSTVAVFIDGVSIGNLDPGRTARSDITSLFSASYDTTHAAGGKIIDTTAFTNGVHTIFWIVSDTGSSSDGIGSRFFTISNGSLLLDPGSGLAANPRKPMVIAAPSTLAIPRAAAARLASSATLESEIAATPRDLRAIQGRRGFNLERALQTYTPSGNHILVQAEELDRIELHLNVAPNQESSGYQRTPAGLRPLPIGSTLDASSGVFTWMPGAGYYGAYDLIFVCWNGGRAVARQDVRITLNAKGSNRVGPQTIIDAPDANAPVGSPFVVGGWAADLDSAVDSGVNTVHVWAYPVDASGQRRDPIFLGPAAYGGARPDVEAIYGDRFASSGYEIIVNTLPPGTYDIAVFAYSTVVNNFTPAKVVRVVVR